MLVYFDTVRTIDILLNMSSIYCTVKDKARIAERLASVGGHYAWEKLSNQKARKPTDVPGSASAITPEWLTSTLCPNVPGAQVLNCSLTGGSSGTSERQGLFLELNDEARNHGIAQHIYTKSSATYRQRLTLGLVGIIAGEVDFYRQIRPQLDIETPRGYFTCIDHRSWRSMILIEDIVQSKGTTFISTETYITKEKMQDLLSNMAKWHGTFWNSPQFSGPLQWLRTPSKWLSAVNRFISHKDRCKLGVRLSEKVIPSSMLDQTDVLFYAMLETLEMAQSTAQTFLHGDPHIGQAYITNEGKLGYGDWQIVMRGSWGYDYAYALISALTVEDRRAWEVDLLKFYLDRLKSEGGEAPTFDAAWKIYRQNSAYGYFCWLSTIAGSAKGTTPDMQPQQVCLDIIHRAANAMKDLEIIRAL